MTSRIRSLLVSVVTTALDVGLFVLCTLLLVGTVLPIARWLCGAVGAVCNFLLNRAWAFRAASGRLRRQALRYGVTSLLAVTLGTLLWWTLWRLTGLDPRLLHVASLGLVWLFVSFPLLRGWVFAAGTRDA
jgi:putative flippase GtrA